MGDKASRNRSSFELLGGEVRVWIEQEAIHMIAIDHRDPVELTEDMAKELAVALLEMVAQLED